MIVVQPKSYVNLKIPFHPKKTSWKRYCERCGVLKVFSSRLGRVCEDCYKPNYGRFIKRNLKGNPFNKEIKEK